MTYIAEKNTLSQVFVKGNDYGTEEWCKQLLQNVTSKKLDNVNAFVGVVRFPSDDFLDHQLNQHQTTQFQNSIYVGYMDMLLPKPETNGGIMGFTKLVFNLDGVERSFLQVAKGDTLDVDGIKFKDYITGLFPGSNADGLVFSRDAMHYLTNIQLSGSYYKLSASNHFEPVTVGTFTPSIEFEFLVSGYKCLLL